MSGSIIPIDSLSDAIKDELDSLNKEVIEKVNKAAEKAAKDGAKELKATSPVRSDGYNRKRPAGSYAKGWSAKVEETNAGLQTWVIYNRTDYQLTHLLEFGHIIAKTGKRSRAITHISPVNQSAAEEFAQNVEDMDL
jgi:hypothetical protein